MTTLQLACGCSDSARCAVAWQLREEFTHARLAEDFVSKHAIIRRYAVHVAALYPTAPPGTEWWPMWDPAKETTL